MPYPPSQNRSHNTAQTPDFVNAWFALKFLAFGWRLLLFITGALLFGAFMVAYDVAGPTVAQNGLVWFLYGTTLIGVFGFLILVLTFFLRVLQFLTGTGRFNPANRPAPPTMNERFINAGMAANPPEPWWNPDGTPIYTMTAAGWVKRSDLELLQTAQPATQPATKTVRLLDRGF